LYYNRTEQYSCEIIKWLLYSWRPGRQLRTAICPEPEETQV
jgi:hypothetical protein